MKTRKVSTLRIVYRFHRLAKSLLFIYYTYTVHTLTYPDTRDSVYHLVSSKCFDKLCHTMPVNAYICECIKEVNSLAIPPSSLSLTEQPAQIA